MDTINRWARVALLAIAAAATATTTALVALFASPVGAEPIAVPTPTATAAAVPAKLPLPTASASLPVTSSPPLPVSSAPVPGKLPTTAVPLPSAKASLPQVRASAGPVQATLGPVTASLLPASSSDPSADQTTPVGSSATTGRKSLPAAGWQTGGHGTRLPLGYESGPGSARGLDSLPAAVLIPDAPSAGLTPNPAWGLRQSPGVGRGGVLGRESVAAPSLTQSSPPVTRGQLVLAVLAILALSLVTAEYARGVLLRRRPVR